ncbi:hypothetical protein C1752_03502 [Acaryochloris thomasi RCC1774]|uniref:DUF1501 domain-containing protein n=1 Tax=Acaryochloris thomasi RCC1774 TaxID=1764569 RepID=A0A2W1JH08_9CYAN|nr:DUF1501 domain-containing protein [Acaryochloris thomasi]PZD72666.1 hypothetical protein C1752_03502 [Acaryochloris thomasi RCC1774]
MNRRHFLRYGTLAGASSLLAVGTRDLWFPHHAWGQSRRSPRLIVILLRGAVDGLNVVVPYRESAYYEARPSVAIPQPGQPQGALPLNNQFGLHPALEALMPLWKAGQLAFVHACGSPDATRSHFDAQDYMETGIPGNKRIKDGWLNRLLANLPAGPITQAVNIGAQTPLILSGSQQVTTLPLGKKAVRRQSIDNIPVQEAFDRLYQGDNALAKAYQRGRQARTALLAEFNTEMMQASKGAPSPVNAASDLNRLAKLMTGKTQTQVASISFGNWDTHVNQGSSQGPLANRLRSLGEGIQQLTQALGSTFNDTTIVVMSEFGRTVGENGNQGTDHGHGNVMWILGGQVNGQQVYGNWPGLAETQLYQGRDLAVTTDFRDAIASILTQHMGLNSTQLAQVFPGHSVQQTLPIF